MLLTVEDWQTLKKLNDDLWVFYSGYGMPVLLFFLIYKLINPIFWQEIREMKQFPKLK